MKRVLSFCILLAALNSLSFTFAQSGNDQRQPGTASSRKIADGNGLKGQETASAEKRGQGEKDPAPEGARAANDSGNVGGKTEAKRYYDAGMALLEAGKFSEAIPKLKQSVKLEPGDAQSQYSLGIAYLKAKKLVDAADSFKRAVRLKPDWAEAHFRLAWMNYTLGRRDQAESEYQKLQSLNPSLASELANIIKVRPKTDGAKDKPDGQASAQEPGTTPGKENQSNSGNTTEPATAVPAAKPAVSPTNTTDNALMNVYRVGVGDVLDIRILNSTTRASTLYTVIDGGLIEFPLVGGSLSVAGLTTDEIQKLLANELKRRAVQENGPLSVGVRQYTSHSVVITGLVGAPGTKMLRREAVPLYVLLAEAQPRLDAARVTVMRAGGAAFTAELADQSSLNFLIRAGDVITLGSRPPEFYYIGGRVSYPGQKNFQAGITLLQAILAAGGLVRASDNTVEISRESGDGRLSTTKYGLKEIKAGKVPDPRLLPGDRIEVLH